MGKRQVRQMFRLMATGEPVQLTSPMASVKKLARLAFLAQQFGYEYADVRQGSGRNNALTMLIVPDPAPQAQARAAQNWAQYPKAGDGVSLPPVVPDALELLKARINFDLTGKNAEKRMRYAFFGLTVACVVLGVRNGGDSVAWTVAGVLWALLMVVLGIGLVVTRKRNAKFAARLRAAGFAPVTEEGGRVRYLPPTAGGYGGHGGYGGPGGYAGHPGYPVPGGQPAGPYTPYAPPHPTQAPYGAQAPGPGPYNPSGVVPSPAQSPGLAPGPYGAGDASPGPYNPSGAIPPQHPQQPQYLQQPQYPHQPNPYSGGPQVQPQPHPQPQSAPPPAYP